MAEMTAGRALGLLALAVAGASTPAVVVWLRGGWQQGTSARVVPLNGNTEHARNATDSAALVRKGHAHLARSAEYVRQGNALGTLEYFAGAAGAHGAAVLLANRSGANASQAHAAAADLSRAIQAQRDTLAGKLDL